MAKKPARHFEHLEVVYDADRWALLENFRKKAMDIMEALDKPHLETIVHGSIARGDVTEKSDVDVFVKSQTSSFTVETALENASIPVNRRLVVQATPTYAMKAHIEIDEKTSVSFPLMKMRKVEREFYKFSGEATLDELRKGLRLSGVDIRRDEIGRTGVFVKKELSEEETFEMALRRLANQNPAVRRRLVSLS